MVFLAAAGQDGVEQPAFRGRAPVYRNCQEDIHQDAVRPPERRLGPEEEPPPPSGEDAPSAAPAGEVAGDLLERPGVQGRVGPLNSA